MKSYQEGIKVHKTHIMNEDQTMKLVRKEILEYFI